MLGKLSIKHKICQIFQSILRITNTTPDIPQRCILIWKWLELCFNSWKAGVVLVSAHSLLWKVGIQLCCCILLELKMSNLHWGKKWLHLAAPWCWWSWAVESNPGSREAKTMALEGSRLLAPPVCYPSSSARQGGLHSLAGTVSISATPQRLR